MQKENNRWKYWSLAAGASLLLRFIFMWKPNWCEQFYTRGLFIWIRHFFDATFGLLPLTGLHLFALGLGLLLSFRWYKMIQLWKNGAWSIKKSSQALLGWLSAILTTFLWIWGYNYTRIPMADQLDLQPLEHLSYTEIRAEALFVQKACNRLRSALPGATNRSLNKNDLPPKLEEEMRTCLKKVLARYNYDTIGNVRCRMLAPKGSLLSFSSTGLYFPYTGEGHVEAGLHPTAIPFTMAHEMAHGYGFGNEAVCNFLGFLACLESKHTAIQYIGYLTYWRYVFGELRAFMSKADYLKLRNAIPKEMQLDLEGIYTSVDSYPPLFPVLQQATYDLYLKSQGVQEGVKSYSRIVRWVIAWRKKYAND